MSRIRRVMLAVSGLNPQVITEALYCLNSEGRMVDEIHCVTTRKGRDLLLSSLLDGGKGPLYRFCAEYGAAPPVFPPENIHVPTDARGREVNEILAQEDNEALLALCLRLAARATADADTAVCFLVSGGRKTMAACLSFAAMTYGRPQDRIYHALVSPDFERSRDFWYPPREPRLLELRDENGLPFMRDTRHASVQLVALPFVPLRGHIERSDPKLLSVPPDEPGGLLAALVREDECVFTVSSRTGDISCATMGGMDLSPAPLALLAFFCEKRLECDAPAPADATACPPWFVSLEEVFAGQKRITELYEAIRVGRPGGAVSDTGIIGLNQENFNSYKSRINAELKRRFGPHGEKLAIQSRGTRPNTRYGLMIERSRLRLEW